MPTAVTWNGTAYSIPNSGELNWATLTNFLVDLGNNAQTTNFQNLAQRKATSTPVTVAAATDCVILVNVGSATTVDLPAGAAGQIFYVLDISGAAATNNITIDPNAAETITGASTYVVTRNNGGVGIIWNDTDSDWEIFTEIHRGTFDANDGAVGAPSITNVGDLNTGMYFPAADTVALTTGGTEGLRINSSQQVGFGIAPSDDLHVQAAGPGSFLTADGSTSGSAKVLGLAADSSEITYFIGSSQTHWGIQSGGANRMTLTAAGVLSLSAENISIGTAGKGIVFAAGGGDPLSHYEEQDITDDWENCTGTTAFTGQAVRVGDIVTVTLDKTTSGFITRTGSGQVTATSSLNSGFRPATARTTSMFEFFYNSAYSTGYMLIGTDGTMTIFRTLGTDNFVGGVDFKWQRTVSFTYTVN
jgi:hypothetical protein